MIGKNEIKGCCSKQREDFQKINQIIAVPEKNKGRKVLYPPILNSSVTTSLTTFSMVSVS